MNFDQMIRQLSPKSSCVEKLGREEDGDITFSYAGKDGRIPKELIPVFELIAAKIDELENSTGVGP